MNRHLHVLIDGSPVGRVDQQPSGKLSFAYLDAWRDGDRQIPLSLSMPLAGGTYGDKTIQPWMWNLLPDNEYVLERWGRRFHCSPRNAFALLSHVGEDCAGAVQFLTDEMLGSQTDPDAIDWLTTEDVAHRLAELRADAAAGRRRNDTGQFSLAGAQSKTAFHLDPATQRWGVPKGRLPTTHIFKPPLPHLSGQPENEHFCLRLAQEAGMYAANSRVTTFGDEQAIVVERYDRLPLDDRTVQRLHQEDMYQALAVHPMRKYENEGGPGAVPIMKEVLSRSDKPAIDRARFMESLAFNFLIGGTDAHAKNFSMLLGEYGSARMAPLYDVASILPHLGEGQIEADLRDIGMAMRVSGKYLMRDILPRHWVEAANAAAFSPDYMLGLLRHHLATLPDIAARTARLCRDEGLDHPVIDRLVDLIGERAAGFAPVYGAAALPAADLPGHAGSDDDE